MPPSFYNPDEEVEQLAPLIPDVRQEPVPGGTSRFTAAQLDASRDATKHRDSAMELLGRALSNQPEITPSQGFAASLLAAIPTIGGYLVGKSVGRPNIPAGTYFKGVTPSEFNREFGSSGANAGGAMGAQIGQEASQGYFNKRDQEIKQQIPVLEKQAVIENQAAQQLDSQSQTMNLHGLEAEEWRDRLPLQAKKEMEVQDHQAAISRGNYKYELEHPKASTNDFFAGMTPEQKAAYYAKKTGLNSDGTVAQKPDTPESINQELALQKASSELGSGAGKTVFGMRTADGAAQNIIATAIKSGTGQLASPADGLSLIESFGRSLNPGAVLREAALQAAMNAVSPYQKIKGELQNVLDGTGQLTLTTATQLANAIHQRRNEYETEFKNGIQPILEIAKAHGVPIERVIPPDFMPTSPGGKLGGAAGLPNRADYKTPEEYLNALNAVGR